MKLNKPKSKHGCSKRKMKKYKRTKEILRKGFAYIVEVPIKMIPEKAIDGLLEQANARADRGKLHGITSMDIHEKEITILKTAAVGMTEQIPDELLENTESNTYGENNPLGPQSYDHEKRFFEPK
jgi:hypothetical protein